MRRRIALYFGGFILVLSHAANFERIIRSSVSNPPKTRNLASIEQQRSGTNHHPCIISHCGSRGKMRRIQQYSHQNLISSRQGSTTFWIVYPLSFTCRLTACYPASEARMDNRECCAAYAGNEHQLGRGSSFIVRATDQCRKLCLPSLISGTLRFGEYVPVSFLYRRTRSSTPRMLTL